jgi:hypothetical protein
MSFLSQMKATPRARSPIRWTPPTDLTNTNGAALLQFPTTLLTRSPMSNTLHTHASKEIKNLNPHGIKG